jgi:hypothetical protein
MKNILFGILILSATLAFTTGNGNLSGENGKLSGVVTYKDYYYESSYHADAGSEIYAISEADLKSTKYADLSDVIENFQRNKAGYSLARYNTLDISRIIQLQNNFDTSSKYTLNYINGFRKMRTVITASTNGQGNYMLPLRPGRYFILVISGNIKSNNILELKGNIEYKIANIKSAGETNLDVNFEKTENIMIMLMTAVQREGC